MAGADRKIIVCLVTGRPEQFAVNSVVVRGPSRTRACPIV
jgi:hypothetical protein